VNKENILTLALPLASALILCLGALGIGGEEAFDKVLPIATMMFGGGIGAKVRALASPPPR